VHAIVGGSLKGGEFGELAGPVREHCRACYLIGEAADTLAEDLAASGVELVRCGDLERAVEEASARARAGEVVLLAPACASFDRYRDFEERGEHFRALVGELR
jgi:UDP-N-acetylmuramoylalanine--D-glutamate ligase